MAPQEPAFDRLLRSARASFGREGFAAASLDAITADAGVTKGSLYHHFRGKADLFEAVFERLAAELSQQVAAGALRERDTWQVAYAGIRGFLDVSQQPEVQRIMLLDAPSVLGWERVREIEAEHGLALIKIVFERLVAENEIPPRDVDVLTHLLFGGLVEAALLIARAADADAARRTAERELRALIDGLRA